MDTKKAKASVEVKNFAHFILWCGDHNLSYGAMEDLIELAKEYALDDENNMYDITTVAFDGDVNDDNSKLIRGQKVLTFFLNPADHNLYITSGL
jgi:hypothetical protein